MTTVRGALKIISAFIKFQYNNSALLQQAVRRRRATGGKAPLSESRPQEQEHAPSKLLHYIARVYIMQISWVHILLMSWCVIALARRRLKRTFSTWLYNL
jgi:hypothetical protein